MIKKKVVVGGHIIRYKAKEAILFFLIAFLLAGCATPEYTWNIEPSTQTVENEYFSASLTPAFFGNSLTGYESFRIKIKNKTAVDIELDWNKTLYIENNQTKGGFMFNKCIAYKGTNNSKPPDIIFPGSTLRKRVWPNALVSYHHGWRNDDIPPGQNGIYLTIKVQDKEVKEKLLLYMKSPAVSQ